MGCSLPPDAARTTSALTFDSLHDAPEAPIAAIFAQTNAFISAGLAAHEAVVVHCVYGQSRSAAVVAAYLLSTGTPLDAALALIKAKRPTTCINPGFMAQLLLVERGGGLASAAVRLIRSTYPSAAPSAFSTGAYTTAPPFRGGGALLCKACKHVLGGRADILEAADADCAAFLAAHTDEYWRGYRPLHAPGDGRGEALPLKGHIVTGPLTWAATPSPSPLPSASASTAGQAVDTVFRAVGSSHRDHRPSSASSPTTTTSAGAAHLLHCPRCGAALGRYRPRGLALCGGFLRVDLHALDADKVALKGR